MAQYYAVSAVSIGSLHIRPGTLLDSTVDASTYNAYVAAGGLPASTSDTNVAAAAAKALRAQKKGADDATLESLMRSGLELDQGVDGGGTPSVTTRVSVEESTRAAAASSLTTRVSAAESTETAAVGSLTTRVSAAESSTTALVLSLTTRISTEESVRASQIASVAAP